MNYDNFDMSEIIPISEHAQKPPHMVFDAKSIEQLFLEQVKKLTMKSVEKDGFGF